VLKRAVQEEGLDQDDIETAVRAHGLARVEDVDQAVLETDGTISVISRQTGQAESGAAQKPPDRPGPTGRAS
jgi:uncharacterized membrane protein YcaP (DUF421 family)